MRGSRETSDWQLVQTEELGGSQQEAKWEIYRPRAQLKVSCSVVLTLSSSATTQTAVSQAPLSMEFSRPEYWSVQPFSSLGDLPDPGIKSGSPALQADSLLPEPPGKPQGLVISTEYKMRLRNQTPQSIQAAIAKTLHRLSSLNNIHFSQFWRLGVHDQGDGRFCVWGKPVPQFVVGDLLPVSLHREGLRVFQGPHYKGTSLVHRELHLITSQ